MSLLNVKYKFLIVTIFSKYSLLTKPVDGILGKYITIASSLYFFFEVIVQHSLGSVKMEKLIDV